jgi:hypothetical protein
MNVFGVGQRAHCQAGPQAQQLKVVTCTGFSKTLSKDRHFRFAPLSVSFFPYCLINIELNLRFRLSSVVGGTWPSDCPGCLTLCRLKDRESGAYWAQQSLRVPSLPGAVWNLSVASFPSKNKREMIVIYRG